MKKFKTVSTAELYTKEIEQTPFIIEDILPMGLTILGGMGKIGKSWLAFWLSMQVAKGQPVWGFETSKGTTLYLAFEDNEERIQNRLYMLSDELENTPNNAYVCIEISKMGGELEDRIKNFLKEHKDTKLIIIDTLQKIRGNTESNYISDYEDITTLKNLAYEYNIGIVVIHHLRKQKDSDVFNQLTGSTGLQGAADTMIVLEQDSRGDKFATLNVVGRDVQRRELKLERGDENIWLKISDSLSESSLNDLNFINAVGIFMSDKDKYSRTATELSSLLSLNSDDNFSNKVISSNFKRLSKQLKKCGITCSFHRTGSARKIEITKNNDVHDNKY